MAQDAGGPDQILDDRSLPEILSSGGRRTSRKRCTAAADGVNSDGREGSDAGLHLWRQQTCAVPWCAVDGGVDSAAPHKMTSRPAGAGQRQQYFKNRALRLRRRRLLEDRSLPETVSSGGHHYRQQMPCLAAVEGSQLDDC